jgi:transposase-like protein
METPKTLQQAIIYYSDADNCIAFLTKQRWPDGIVMCPLCGAEGAKYLPKRRIWQCKIRHPKAQFSIKVGTIFEDSALGLDKWLTAMWLLANSKNGISSHEVAKSIGVTQKSAWHMMHRIRLAMREDGHFVPLGGQWKSPVEVDETFIGGKAKNKHLSQRTQDERKTIVMGMLDRSTREVRAKVIPNVKRETLQAEILKNVGFNAHVFTDGAVGYEGIDNFKNFTHKTVNHIDKYVNGRVHTQSIENFWSLLKRGLNGTYVAVEPFHLDRYVDEQVFRFNNRRKMDDGDRFNAVVSQIVGKKLTYAELTGKESKKQVF